MPYNIIVLIKVIPDLEQIKPNPTTGEIVTERTPLRLETLSENAIEAAVQLKEKYGGKVFGLIFGKPESAPMLKKAFAMGVDDGIVLTGYKGNNPVYTAEVLCGKIKGMQYDLIISGNQSADTYTGLLPGIISGKLGINLLGNALTIALEDRKIRVKSTLEKKIQNLSATLPAIVSVTQETNQPRLPPVMQIMAAGRKQIVTEAAQPQTMPGTVQISNRAPRSERKKQLYEKPEEGIAAVARAIKEEIR